MYHSLSINVGDNYIGTWDDWKLIPFLAAGDPTAH